MKRKRLFCAIHTSQPLNCFACAGDERGLSQYERLVLAGAGAVERAVKNAYELGSGSAQRAWLSVLDARVDNLRLQFLGEPAVLEFLDELIGELRG